MRARQISAIACHDGTPALCEYYRVYVCQQHMWLSAASILPVLLGCCHHLVLHARVHLHAVLPALHDVQLFSGCHVSVVVLECGPEYCKMWVVPQAAQALWHDCTPVWLMTQLDYLPQ